MTEHLFKYINVLDEKTGRALRDRKTGQVISRRVQMSDEEAAAFEAERSPKHTQQDPPQ